MLVLIDSENNQFPSPKPDRFLFYSPIEKKKTLSGSFWVLTQSEKSKQCCSYYVEEEERLKHCAIKINIMAREFIAWKQIYLRLDGWNLRQKNSRARFSSEAEENHLMSLQLPHQESLPSFFAFRRNCFMFRTGKELKMKIVRKSKNIKRKSFWFLSIVSNSFFPRFTNCDKSQKRLPNDETIFYRQKLKSKTFIQLFEFNNESKLKEPRWSRVN